MKLWHIAQWGNKKTGPDGLDTQCIVSAVDLKSAVEKAELHIPYQYDSYSYRNGKADVAYLLGEDSRPDGDPQLIVGVWVDMACNLTHNPAWFRQYESDEWVDQKTMDGEEL